MAVLVLSSCLASGVFLTADCLSLEKREGTLGLLFLTRLRSYDVVIGKLAATSIESIFALLALFPVLGLPLMMGGVTGAEFLRIFVLLISTLIFSLGIGLFVSSLVDNARQALGRTLMTIVAFSVVGPLMSWIYSFLWPATQAFDFVLWTSPGFACVKAFGWGGESDFWRSLAVILLLGIAGVVGACINLQHSVRVGDVLPAPIQSDQAKSRNIVTLFGGDNPYQELVVRQPSLVRVWTRVFAVIAACWIISLLLVGGGRTSPLLTCVLLLYGLHQLLKILMSIEATRRFIEDTESGALELVILTDLGVKAIVCGHYTAVRTALSKPAVHLSVLNIVFLLVIGVFGAGIRLPGDLRAFVSCVLLGGILLLVLDLRALLWCGMWKALATKRQQRAVGATLLLVMIFPWFCIFLCFTGILFQAASLTSIVTMVSLWFAASAAIDLLVAAHAKRQITEHFRELVALSYTATKRTLLQVH